MSVEYFTPGTEPVGGTAESVAAAERPAQPEQVWGAPPVALPPNGGAKQPWSAKQTAIVAVTCVALAVGGGILVTKFASDGSSSAQNGPGGGFPGGGPGGGPGGMNGGTDGGGIGAASVLGNALHGDFVVSDRNGGYRTDRMQKGKATAVSATSITVASDDGYTQSYVVGSSTTVGSNASITDVKSGDTVTVVAQVTGTTATATSVTDAALSDDQQNGGMPGGDGQGFPGGQNGNGGQGFPGGQNGNGGQGFPGGQNGNGGQNGQQGGRATN